MTNPSQMRGSDRTADSRPQQSTPVINSQQTHHQLGLKENWVQFSIFTLITLLIGMTIGVERVALPPLARHAFGITSILYTVSFISGFGAVKAVMNLVSGRLSDHHGRKSLLLIGWAFAIPFALLIIFAQAWWWVVIANLFLGVNQGLTWTMSVTSKIDLVGPVNRGLAVGLDESAGYVGVGLGGFLAGLLVASFGLRPAPYIMTLAIIILGILVTAGLARETLPWAQAETADRDLTKADKGSVPQLSRLATYLSWHDKGMLAVCQAGFLNKFADTLVIGFFPIYFLDKGIGLAGVGTLVGIYALVWGFGQIVTGALADRIGRKIPITSGIFLVGTGIVVILLTDTIASWAVGAIVMGIGMALVYPNLISAVSDVAHPSWRGGALGIYRLWRDGGYALGPLLLGGIALIGGITAAFWATVSLMALSGFLVLFIFHEAEPTHCHQAPACESHPEWVAP